MQHFQTRSEEQVRSALGAFHCKLAVVNLAEDRVYLVREPTDEFLRVHAMVAELLDSFLLIIGSPQSMDVVGYQVRLDRFRDEAIGTVGLVIV